MHDSAKTVAIVIPAYHAEKTILGIIEGIPEWVQFIIVVDDCGQDSTGEVVRSISSNLKIHLIRHDKNLGVGGATLTGYHKAVELGADIIVKMDSDGQMNPDYLGQLTIPLSEAKADYTKGNRFLFRLGLSGMPRKRKIGNTALSFLTKLASGYWNIFDPTNGYTAISANIIPKLDINNISKGFFFETSMLIELSMMRAVVKDIYIPGIYASEKSYLSEWKALIGFPPLLLMGFLRRIKFEYFVRDFTAFSLLSLIGSAFVLFAVIWNTFHWFRSATTGIASTMGTVMIGFLPIILGIQFLLQALIMDIQNIPNEPVHKKFDVIKD